MTLFEYTPLARTKDPDTSHEAAHHITGRAGAIRAIVLDYALLHPNGFTDFELGAAFGNSGSTYRTRRAELTAMGKIVDTGERKTHGSGRRHIVWRIASCSTS